MAVADTQTAPAGALSSGPTCPQSTLAAGASETCTATYTVTQADVNNGSVADSATASGTTPSGGSVVSPPSPYNVPAVQTPGLSMVKSTTSSKVSKVGDVIAYSFLVTNTGNVTVTAVTVNDTQVAPAGALTSGPTCPQTVLVPGQAETCTGTYTVTQADLDNGTVNDSATATGTPPSGPAITTPPSAVTVPAVQTPDLTIVKSATPASVSKVGDVISYRFLVTNTGNVTLTNVAVADTQTAPAGPLTSGPTCPQSTLAPAGSETCTGTYTVTQADVDNGKVADTATASGITPGGSKTTSPPSPASVPAAQNPALSIAKSSIQTQAHAAGDVIDYTFLVTNTGNVTMTSVAVTDTQTAPSGPLAAGPTCPQTALAPAQSETCTGTYTLTQADVDNGSVNDSATATGTAPNGTQFTTPPSPYRVPVPPTPAVTVAKTATPATAHHVGDVITYSFLVTNTGNVTLTKVAVTDAQTAPAGPLTSGPTCPQSTLAPSATETCTGTYTLTQADVNNGRVADSATASGTTPGGSTVTSPPSPLVVPIPPAPAITIVKSASPATVAKVGDVITYSFLVTNTGNVTLTSVAVTDTQTAPAGALASGPTCPQSTLDSGVSETCTGTYTATQADVDNGSVNDSAIASGVDPAGNPVPSPPSLASVPATQTPALTIVKSAAPAMVAKVGDVISYSFLVTNTGNVTLTKVGVADTQTAPAGPLTSGPTCPQSTLAPAATETCTGTYTVTQADLDNGSVNDSAVANGTDPTGKQSVSPPSTAIVAATQTPAITIVKSATPASVAKVGDVIDYSFVVTNTGNVTLNKVAVNDTQTAPAGALTTPPTCPQATLAPAQSETCAATYTVTQADVDNGKVDDTATATGTPPTGPPVTSPPSPAVVPIPAKPSITVVKTANPATVGKVGDVITYSFLVTNTGNVTLTTVAVTDTQTAPAGPLTSGPTCPQSTLAGGASQTCTGTYTVTAADVANGKVNDTATASGAAPGSTKRIMSPPATAVVSVTPPAATPATNPATSATVAPAATPSPVTNSTVPVTG